MADEPEAERLDEEEGGPVKSFLDHLEDLRWVLIKSSVTASVAMLVCLLAGNYLVRFLEWPLQSPLLPLFNPSTTKTARLTIFTNQIVTFEVHSGDVLAPMMGTN